MRQSADGHESATIALQDPGDDLFVIAGTVWE